MNYPGKFSLDCGRRWLVYKLITSKKSVPLFWHLYEQPPAEFNIETKKKSIFHLRNIEALKICFVSNFKNALRESIVRYTKLVFAIQNRT